MSVVVNGTNGLTFADGSTQSTGFAPGMRNRIINGDMRIDQRNAGASVTPTVSMYSLDRWGAAANQSSKYRVQQNAGSISAGVGFSKYLGVTSLSAYTVGSSDYFHLYQGIEGQNISDLAWGTSSAQTVTISFQVYSSLTGTFGGSIFNGAANYSYPFTYSIPVSNTWTSISVVIPGPTAGTWTTDNSAGLYLNFGLGVGSTLSGTAGSWSANTYRSSTGATSVVGTNGATFYITGVQLEKGSVATPFEYRQYGQELALCQRYYEKSYLQGTAVPSSTATGFFSFGGTSDSSNNIKAPIRFAVTKRASPTMTGYDYGTATSGLWNYARSGASGTTAVSFDTIGDSGCRVNINSGVAWAAVTFEGQWTASSEL